MRLSSPWPREMLARSGAGKSCTSSAAALPRAWNTAGMRAPVLAMAQRGVGELRRIEILHFLSSCLTEGLEHSRHACACLRHGREGDGEFQLIEVLRFLSRNLAEGLMPNRHACACLRHGRESDGEFRLIEVLRFLSRNFAEGLMPSRHACACLCHGKRVMASSGS